MDIVQSTTAKGERLTGRQLIDTFRKFWKKDCAETLEQLECCVTRLLIDGYFKCVFAIVLSAQSYIHLIWCCSVLVYAEMLVQWTVTIETQRFACELVSKS